MLLSFSVRNFRCFGDETIFRFDQASDYQFQEDLTEDGIVKKAIVYGDNGAGKSTLCKAMADVVSVLTDFFYSPQLITPLNYGSSNRPVTENTSFCYELLIERERIRYEYVKNRLGLVGERLFSNGVLVLENSYKSTYINFDHFPELKSSDVLKSYSKTASLVKYLSRTGFSFAKKTITRLVSFVNGILFFRAEMDGNQFVGLRPSPHSMIRILQVTNSLHEFEEFLSKNKIKYKLQIESTADPNQPQLKVVFKEEIRDFFDVASTGTRYLLLVFSWLKVLEIEQKPSFLVIDEFDAYYHDDVAINVFSELRKLGMQVVITTHRTCLMQNSIARPDCVFLLQNGSIKSLPELTDRELREANNIEKLYRGGAFTS